MFRRKKRRLGEDLEMFTSENLFVVNIITFMSVSTRCLKMG